MDDANVIVYDVYCIVFGVIGLKPIREWRLLAKGLLKAELKRRNVSYSQLAANLATLGIVETDRNISNKISRGTFTAVFFIQCMAAVGCKTIHLEDL